MNIITKLTLLHLNFFSLQQFLMHLISHYVLLKSVHVLYIIYWQVSGPLIQFI